MDRSSNSDVPLPSRLLDAWRTLLNTSIAVLGIAYLADLAFLLGLDFVPWQEQYTSVVLGLALASVLAGRGGGRGGGRGAGRPGGGASAWLDAALSLLGLAAGVYLAVQWPAFASGEFQPWDFPVAVATVALLLEATRRSVGTALFVLGGLAVVFGLTAAWLPPPLSGRSVEVESLFMYLYADTSGIVGLPLAVSATVVLAFVLFGTVAFFAGGGQVFIDLALATMGRFRGGPAKAAIVASSLFGSISGSAVANVVATGSLTIPLMRRAGYRPAVAGGIEAVSSTGGQLMPPVMGATAFLMADFLGRPYTDIAIAALVPALLFYFCIFVQVHLEAARADIRPIQRADLPRLGPLLARSWLLLVPLATLIGLLFFRNWEPSRAALASAAVALAAGIVHRRGRIGPGELLGVLADAGRSMLDLLVITAMAGLVVGALGITGVGFSFALQIVDLAGGNLLLLLLLTALTGLVLGMGMPTTGVYILLAVLAAPALVQLGVPAMAAHLFVLYFGMLSMITPPVCLAAFTAAAIADANGMRTGFTSMRLGGACYVIPFIFALSPVLLLEEGTTGELVQALGTAILGVSALAVALAGFLVRPLGWVGRAAMAVGSLLLMWPDRHDDAGALGPVATDLAGMALVGLVAAMHWMGGRGDRLGASLRIEERDGRRRT